MPTQSFTGTVPWMAPEICRNEPYTAYVQHFIHVHALLAAYAIITANMCTMDPH